MGDARLLLSHPRTAAAGAGRPFQHPGQRRGCAGPGWERAGGGDAARGETPPAEPAPVTARGL